MPTFNYVSGNPSNLTGGGAANMADIQGPLTDLRSAINGNLDETNVPNLSAAFTHWKTIETRSCFLIAQGASSFCLGFGGGGVLFTTAQGAGPYAFFLDPTDYNANSRQTKMRMRWTLLTNSVASTMNFSTGLGGGSGIGGNTGVQPGITSVATVSGSTAAFTAPAINSVFRTDSSEFNAPAAGLHIMFIAPSGNMAAGSSVAIIGQLQMRQV